MCRYTPEAVVIRTSESERYAHKCSTHYERYVHLVRYLHWRGPQSEQTRRPDTVVGIAVPVEQNMNTVLSVYQGRNEAVFQKDREKGGDLIIWNSCITFK